jgi:hypothetical protein
MVDALLHERQIVVSADLTTRCKLLERPARQRGLDDESSRSQKNYPRAFLINPSRIFG